MAALAATVVGFFGPRTNSCLTQFPRDFALASIALPFAIFGVAALRAPHSPFFAPRLAAFIDARAGHGSLESFLVRLKPMLLFGTGGLIDGWHQLWWCDQAGLPVTLQSKGWFYISGGAAFILMHVILRLRKVPAV